MSCGGSLTRLRSGHLFGANDVIAEVQQPISYALSRCVLGHVGNHWLDWCLGFGVECIRRQVCVVEAGFHCVIVHHVLGEYPCSVSNATELEYLFGHAFPLYL
jgi:hypothetical protein